MSDLGKVKKFLKSRLSKLLEDTDRVRRHNDGYGDDLEEDTDRVRRHNDGYGDDLEEDIKEKIIMALRAREVPHPQQDPIPTPPVHQDQDKCNMPDLTSLVDLDESENMVDPEKAKKILKHGHIHGKTLSKSQKHLFGMIAAGEKSKDTKKDKE